MAVLTLILLGKQGGSDEHLVGTNYLQRSCACYLCEDEELRLSPEM